MSLSCATWDCDFKLNFGLFFWGAGMKMNKQFPLVVWQNEQSWRRKWKCNLDDLLLILFMSKKCSYILKMKKHFCESILILIIVQIRFMFQFFCNAMQSTVTAATLGYLQIGHFRDSVQFLTNLRQNISVQKSSPTLIFKQYFMQKHNYEWELSSRSYFMPLTGD